MEKHIWHILLIDEDEDDCLLTRDMLQDAQARQIEMEWAPSFDAGIEILHQKEYDAVLVDYDLKPKNGIDLIREFSAYPAPLILYSGQAVYEIELEALQAGATAYLSKREATPLLLERLIRYAIEHKRSLARLEQSERSQQELIEKMTLDQRKLAAVLESLPVGVWIADTDGLITGKNEEADRIWAGDAPLLGVENYQEYPAWWADRDERVLPEEYPVARVLRTGEPVEPVEMRIRRFDGSEGWVLVSAAPMRDDDGQLTGVVGINLDITRQHQAEERFAKAFLASPMALAISRLEDGKILEINESYARLTGYSQEQSFGKTALELGILTDPAERTRNVALLNKQGFLRDMEFTFHNRSGEERLVNFSAERIVINGEPYILSLIDDITDKRRSEAALEAAHAEAEEGRRTLQALLEYVPEGISITGGPPDFRIKHFSRWAAKTTGREPHELIDHPAGQHQQAWGLRLEDGETVPEKEKMPLYIASRDGVETGHIDMVVETKDGTKIPILMKAAPIRDQQGQITGAISYWLDISERKQAEALAAQKVIEADASAREANLQRAEMDALFNQMDEAVILCDLEGVPQKVNPRTIQTYGFDPTGMQPQEIASRIAATDLQGKPRQPEIYLTQLAREGTAVRSQTIRFTSAVGRNTIVSASGNPFYNMDGEMAGIMITWHDITEREEDAQALRESEERFRLARQAIEGVVYDWDPVQYTIHQLDGAHSVLGLPAGESLPADSGWWQSRIHPEDAPKAQKNLKAVLEGKTNSIDQEYRFRHFDGYWIHLWDRAFVVRDVDHRAVRVVGIAADISERKEAEARALFLQKLGRDLNAVYRSEEAGQMVVDRLGLFLDVDRCLITEPDLAARTNTIRFDYQRPGVQITGPDRLPWSPSGLAKELQEDEVMVVEDAVTDPRTASMYDPILSDMAARAFVLVPFTESESRILLLAVVCGQPHRWRDQDIHFLQQAARLTWMAIERAEVAERLRQSEERFRIALDNAPISVFTQDRSLHYTWIYNPLVGFDKSEVIGRSDQDLLPDESADRLTTLKREVIEFAEPRQQELKLTIDGRDYSYLLNAKPTFNSQGEVIGLVAAVMDITDIRRLQAQQIEVEASIQVQRWLMEHREKERMQLARTLHDKPLQDLLAAHLYLNNASDDLGEDYPERIGPVRQMLEQAIEEVRAVALDLRPPMLMHMGLEKAMRAYANSFRQRNPTLLVQLDLEPDRQILSEDTRLTLYRIFQELLQNVREHSRAGEVLITLQFKSDKVVLTVSDDGTGFETPDQWIELARSGRFGLVGINERVEALDGTIVIDTKPGKGTRVEVEAPVA